MTSITTKPDSLQLEAETAPQLFDNWFDPIETEVRGRGSTVHRGAHPRRARRGSGSPSLWARQDGQR
jgi:hypothetical protein